MTFIPEIDGIPSRSRRTGIELGPYDFQGPFEFLRFADGIYNDKPCTTNPFRFPALYGGDQQPGDQYEALIVLQDPSESLTKDGWGSAPCASTVQAIQRHRRIFLDWAYTPDSNQELLFRTFSYDPTELFAKCYITDVWKHGKNHPDRAYWLNALRTELKEVKATHVVCVGNEARDACKLIFNDAEPNHVAFPRNKNLLPLDDYKVHVADLWERLHRSECHENVRIVKPEELTEAEFDGIESLISEGGEVTTAHLAERLKASTWIAFKTSEGQLACVGAIKAARPDYIKTLARKSGYRLDAEDCGGEFGYVVTREAFRARGMARELSVALLRDFGGTLFATTRDDNPGIHKIVRENGFVEVGQRWRSREHPNSMLVLWLKK